MRNTSSALACLFVAAMVAGLFTGVGSAGARQTQEATEAGKGYAWAPACKECHSDIYTAWEKTKHAKAMNRLSADDQAKECLGCHVTGPKVRIELEGKLQNGGIQCESCHGAAAQHAADATVLTGLVKKPAEKVCAECHNERSPHFKGLFFGAMVGMVHRVK